MLVDLNERQQASDPTQSFIVQAPAGSGKTEILTQRYLRLLSLVHAPEQIIALTFTRKAAQEMRTRIIHALQHAAEGLEARSEHQATTTRYAQAALERDRALHWHLLAQPSRMRIMTIDALCQTLTHAVPILEQPMDLKTIRERPFGLYQQAALACFQNACADPTYHEPLKILLTHLDNRQEHLIDLWTDLLSQRDQWLGMIYQAKQQSKEVFEHALALIEQHEFLRFKKSLPDDLASTLVQLSRDVACLDTTPDSPRAALKSWMHPLEMTRAIATSLASLLLTSQSKLRQAFDHHVGLRRDACDAAQYTSLKAASKQLFEQLRAYPDFLDALLRIRHLPEPQYAARQWNVLNALFALLPRLVAHLHIIFNQQHCVDFVAIAQHAIMALGDEQEPTDLTLALDHQINHVLIDEFQDTSMQQFQLLTQLVQGWEPHDGRTLFVVGDPMQSIYRFRGAEVGLFIRAREQGIGPVHLIPLELRCNFRSTAALVHWVNFQFQSIFPSQDDMESGAISYLSAQETQVQDRTEPAVVARQFESKEEEAADIVKTIRDELLAHPQDNIAILVRSRRQLSSLIAQLKQAQIPFQGVDLDPLAQLPHIQDVWNLTQALLMPANRFVWLALLRSPWCGITLADLEILANVDKKKSMAYALGQHAVLPSLSDDGRQRAQWIDSILHNALMRRHQQRLVPWIMDTLHNMPIHAILTPRQQDDLAAFWNLLDQHDEAGCIKDLRLFKQDLEQLYAKQVTPASVHIMTIHKSKGLEFDTVMCPGLGSRSIQPDQPFIRWLQLPSQRHGSIFLISPIKAAGDRIDPVYRYLSHLDAQKNAYEQQRLLYVAVTRAKKRLYLFDHHLTPCTGTFKHLLSQHVFSEGDATTRECVTDQAAPPLLMRLPLSFYQQSPEPVTSQLASTLPLHTNTARLFGIIAHELLQWICTYHPASRHDLPWTLVRHRLTQTGLSSLVQENAQHQLQHNMQQFFNCPIAQWIMKAHEQERNEYEWLVRDGQDVVTKIIDRTFIDQGIRWIIDFKTGRDDQADVEKHQEQVNAYAHLFGAQSSQPIRCGLYYLTHTHWISWEPDSFRQPDLAFSALSE